MWRSTASVRGHRPATTRFRRRPSPGRRCAGSWLPAPLGPSRALRPRLRNESSPSSARTDPEVNCQSANLDGHLVDVVSRHVLLLVELRPGRPRTWRGRPAGSEPPGRQLARSRVTLHGDRLGFVHLPIKQEASASGDRQKPSTGARVAAGLDRYRRVLSVRYSRRCQSSSATASPARRRICMLRTRYAISGA